MADFPQIDTDKFQADAVKAMAIPLGFASPLWLAYGAMASAGMAYWWMSQLTKPANVEAFSGMVGKYSAIPVPETHIFEAPLMAVVTEAVIEDVPETLIPEPALVAAAVEPMTEAAQVYVEAAPKIMEAATDDLTKLVGIGPTLASKLSDLGVKSFADIATWTADDIEKFDKSLNLMGRATREKWIDQARQFADQVAH
jgi:predicted flap endonuclease-1-like 5' DNA nuclease